MALIKCPECGKENVSDSAEMCPDCGYGIKAHFAEIERKKELEKIETERRQRREEQERIQKEKEEAELNTIKIPSKPPSLRRYWFIFGIVFVLLGLLGILLPIPYLQIIFRYLQLFWIIFSCLFYSKVKDMVKNYDRAQQDFVKYQREELAKKKMQKEMERYRQANAPKCPHCGSTNIRKISTLNRFVSVAAVGVASGKIGKQYKCSSCGHMW